MHLWPLGTPIHTQFIRDFTCRLLTSVCTFVFCASSIAPCLSLFLSSPHSLKLASRWLLRRVRSYIRVSEKAVALVRCLKLQFYQPHFSCSKKNNHNHNNKNSSKLENRLFLHFKSEKQERVRVIQFLVAAFFSVIFFFTGRAEIYKNSEDFN